MQKKISTITTTKLVHSPIRMFKPENQKRFFFGSFFNLAYKASVLFVLSIFKQESSEKQAINMSFLKVALIAERKFRKMIITSY